MATKEEIWKEINRKLKPIALEISNICFSDNTTPLLSVESSYSLKLKNNAEVRVRSITRNGQVIINITVK